MKYRKRLSLAAALLLASQASMAAVSDADFQALKDSIAVMTEKMNAMEKELAAEKAKAAAPAEPVAAAPAAAPAPAKASWTDALAWKGDFRYRYENIDEEGKSERNRSRIRARAGLVAQMQPDLKVGFGLGTGTDGDPVSGNQTLGGGGSRKEIYVDVAYFEKSFADYGLVFTGGKFKNFLTRVGGTQMLWDGDWNPEGLGLIYQGDTFFANALGSWLDGDSSGGSTFIAGGQAGFSVPLADGVKLTAGVGYYDLGLKGKNNTFVVDDEVEYFGNSFVCNPPASTDPEECTYVVDYQELEGFAEVAFSALGLPVSVFVDYVQNQDAKDNDTGYTAGFTLGELATKGDWEFYYAYQDLEADAVLALLTDSDFGGGGTDTRGHVFRGFYALGNKWNIGASYFLNDIGMDAGNKRDYDRLQLDMNFKY